MNEGAIAIEGRTSKKRFFAAILAGLIFLSGFIVFLGAKGALAAQIGGIGTFTVKFDKMVGSDYKLYGSVYSDNDHLQPVLVNDIGSVTIYGLQIIKDVSIPGLGDWTVNISSGTNNSKPVKINGLIQNATNILGDGSFSNMEIGEHATSNPSEAFKQTAKTVTITNGNLDTNFLSQKSASLPDLKVSISKKTK